MHLFFKNKQILIFICLLSFLTPYAAGAKTYKSRHSRQYLVPPPPPYVPSMLPELSHNYGYGQGYPYSGSQINSPRIYKPNKYLTYYFPNKS